MPRSADRNFFLAVLPLLVAVMAAGCGGGSSDSSLAGTAAATPAIVNTAALVIDLGPPQVNAINALYTSVTVCVVGSASVCQTIDHILVDTGSTGLRVLAAALGGGLTSAQLTQSTDASGRALVECTQFVDGYSWGPVKLAKINIAGESAASAPIQVIGDPAYPSSLAPASCINAVNAEEDTVAQFGANGVLGVGNFLQDCGTYCAQTGSQDGSAYNACSSTAPVTCVPAAVPVSQQVQNPVALFASDNNGVLISLPTFSAAGAVAGAGTMTFGIGTQSDNALGAAGVYTLDPTYGTLTTVFNGRQLTQSFVDTGSNGYFFPDSAVKTCSDQSGFFCPAATLSLAAQMQGVNGTVASVSFSVSNVDLVPAVDSVDPGLAGPAGTNTLQAFDWGLPFFYGRGVYIVFEGAAVGNTHGPAVAF